MKRFGEIYKITCLINKKIYIGQTTIGYLKRFRDHIAESNRAKDDDNICFHNAIRKYGWENFDIEVICHCPIELLDKMERFYITKFKTNICRHGDKYGYNLTDGGEGGKGYKHTEETKKRISEIKIKYFQDNPEYKPVGMTGKNQTEEWKEENSKRMSGENNPMYDVHLASPFKDKYHTEESKRKMRESMKGRVPWNKGIPMTEEQKEKLRKARTGCKASEEAKENMSKSHKGKEPWNKGLTGIFSEEILEKMSKDRTGKPIHTEEFKRKLGERNRERVKIVRNNLKK